MFAFPPAASMRATISSNRRRTRRFPRCAGPGPGGWLGRIGDRHITYRRSARWLALSVPITVKMSSGVVGCRGHGVLLSALVGGCVSPHRTQTSPKHRSASSFGSTHWRRRPPCQERSGPGQVPRWTGRDSGRTRRPQQPRLGAGRRVQCFRTRDLGACRGPRGRAAPVPTHWPGRRR